MEYPHPADIVGKVGWRNLGSDFRGLAEIGRYVRTEF
jgi:hypothetical protein